MTSSQSSKAVTTGGLDDFTEVSLAPAGIKSLDRRFLPICLGVLTAIAAAYLVIQEGTYVLRLITR